MSRRNFLSLHTIFITALLVTSLTVKGEDLPCSSSEALFTIKTDESIWDGSWPDLKSDEMGGTEWSAKAFRKSGNGLKCGIGDREYVAYIKSDAPVKDKVGVVSAYFIVPEMYKEYLRGITLRVSENGHTDEDGYLTDYTEISYEGAYSPATYWNFYIPQPKENLYYQLLVDFKKSGVSDWIQLDLVHFFGVQADPEMLADRTNDGGFRFMAHDGDLHLIAHEYDKENDTWSAHTPSSYPFIEDDDTTWQNWVANPNEEYVIYPSQDRNKYLKVRAKTVSGDTHSAELVKYLNLEGVSTLVESMTVDFEEDDVEWYNMQGIRVDNPGKGIFIKITDGKALKIVKR